eukprot:scaffold47025_cov15-Tisochrysis_lutea.AAC.1
MQAAPTIAASFTLLLNQLAGHAPETPGPQSTGCHPQALVSAFAQEEVCWVNFCHWALSRGHGVAGLGSPGRSQLLLGDKKFFSDNSPHRAARHPNSAAPEKKFAW